MAAEKNHKTISAAHVLDAVKQLGWDDGGELHRQLKKDLSRTHQSGWPSYGTCVLSDGGFAPCGDGIDFRAANEAKKKGLPPPAAPPKAPKPAGSAPAAPSASDLNGATADPSAAGAEGDEAGPVPVLRNEGPNADEADLYFGADDLEEDDLDGVEEYVDEGEDDEMEDAGSEGIDDDEVANRGLEEKGDDADEADHGGQE